MTEARYTLRDAREEDFAYLYALHVRTMREAVERTWGWNEDTQRRMFRESFGPAELHIVVRDEIDVGVLSVERRPDEIFLKLVEIDREAQGKGVGSAIIDDLLAEARTRNQPLRLRVLKVNQDALRLYRRLGFRDAGETETHYSMEIA